MEFSRRIARREPLAGKRTASFTCLPSVSAAFVLLDVIEPLLVLVVRFAYDELHATPESVVCKEVTRVSRRRVSVFTNHSICEHSNRM